MENPELEALDHLVHSEGWRVFREMVNKDWGPAGERYISAVNNTMRVGDEVSAVQQMRQVIVAQREISAVMQMPETRLKQLKQAEQRPELVGQSRRGSL
jgi:hypothetical protein